MTDIIGLARSKRQALEAEIASLDAFLKTAEELLVQAGLPSSNNIVKHAAAPETAPTAADVPELPRAVPTRPKVPSDALFQKLLADQRARRASQDEAGDSFHFETKRQPAAYG